MLFIVVGYKGSGKDTAVTYLRSNLKGTYQVALADAIKQVTSRITNTIAPAYGDRENLIPGFPCSYRTAWQQVGENMKKIFGVDVWCKAAEDTMSDLWMEHYKNCAVGSFSSTPHFFISDGRFPEEIAYFKRRFPEVTVIKIHRTHTPWYKKLFWHKSEKAVDKIKADFNVYNVGTVDTFYKQLDVVVDLVKARYGSK